MKNRKIAISDIGTVTVPSKTKMSICEIADLFGIYYQIAKREIRAIEKSGIVNGDYSMSCVVEGQKVIPEYYGLEMVIAVAFRIQSVKANIFRKWIVKKVLRYDITATLVLQLQHALLTDKTR